MKMFKLGFVMLLTVILNACAGLALPDRSEFHQAALMGDPELVKRLIPAQASIDEYDSMGFAAIHWAASAAMGDPAATLKVLLQAGANPNLPQETANMTPLFFAVSPDIVNILVDAGANIEHKSIDGGTPLHHAKTLDVLNALLARGADKDSRDMQGRTPKERFESVLVHLKQNPSLSHVVADYERIIDVLGGPSARPDTAPKSGFVNVTADANDTTFSLPDVDSLIAAQACPMSEESWIYTGEFCVEGIAHGKGSAQHRDSPLRFEGLIESGLPVEGVLFENDTESYEGAFKEGLAHGSGICYFEGLPEECRYFKGQRIDTLHKQRIEFDRQQALANKVSKRQTRQVVQQPAESNTLGDAVGEEILEQGAKFIFDKLF